MTVTIARSDSVRFADSKIRATLCLLLWLISPPAPMADVQASNTTLPDKSGTSMTDPSGERRSMLTLAVLGDSDSHSYHDSVMLGYGKPLARGGHLQANTWQWTEILTRLRGQQIDLGEVGTWGRSTILSRALGVFGVRTRAPRKQDYRYNFAISGAGCHALADSANAQVDALIETMRADPRRWRDAVVLIRIGINDLGTELRLAGYADSGLDATATVQVDRCVEAVRQAVLRIRAEQAETGIILVGILNNVDWPRLHRRWRDRAQLDRIRQVMDAYDSGLQAIAAGDSRIVFHDDRAWFAALWGSRDSNGMPAYRAVSFGGVNSVTLSEGDEPVNAVIADGHAGTIWNGLWARQVVRILNRTFGCSIQEISDAEIIHIADPQGRFGLLP